MDVLPSGSIFHELKVVHDTGYFDGKVSPEERWQQVSQKFKYPLQEIKNKKGTYLINNWNLETNTTWSDQGNKMVTARQVLKDTTYIPATLTEKKILQGKDGKN